MEIIGKSILKLPLQTGVSKAGNNWSKQEYVLETQENFPKKVHFDFFGDRATQYDLQEGQMVKLSFDIESREFNGKWYTSVTCYGYELNPTAPTDENGQEMTNEQINENLAKMYGAQPQATAKPQVQVQPQQAEDLPF